MTSPPRDPGPALSVVIPVYNAGSLLAAQLDALANQDFPEPWELILADNGSTDDGLAAVAAYSHRLAVRVIDASATQGPAFARNAGAAAANGEWIAFCDADDVADPHWLTALYGARQDGAFVGGAHEVQLLNTDAAVDGRGGNAAFEGLPRSPRHRLAYAGTANMLIRRADFERLGGFDTAFPFAAGEDIDLSWRAQLEGLKLIYASDAVMHYRLRSTPRSAYRQSRVYKLSEAKLYERHGSTTMDPPPPDHILARLWWLTSRSPFLLSAGRRRQMWFAALGDLVGVIESKPHRVERS